MTRWVRAALSGIFLTPVLVVALLMLLFAWTAAAQIYAGVLGARGSSGFAGVALAVVNAACCSLLVFGLAGFVGDVRELRLPRQRQVGVSGLILVLVLTLVAPWLLVWWLKGGIGDLLLVAGGWALGTAAALLWRRRSRSREVPRAPVGVIAPPGAARGPNPWRAMRVALGAPYAPASWRRRLLELVSLCAMVALAPALVLLYRDSLSERGFTILLRASEVVGFLPAMALCWIWPLWRLIAVFNPRGGAVTELALLPGLGRGGQQLRRLFLVAASLPAGALIVLLIIAARLIALEHLPHAVYIKLAVQFVLIGLMTVPVVIGRIARPRESVGWFAIVFPQIWTYTVIIWSDTWNGLQILPAAFRWLAAGIVLVGLMVPIVMSIIWLRKLLQRPHPFVEMPA